jgi:predicted transposase/invertase (TIGR01784 family)
MEFRSMKSQKLQTISDSVFKRIFGQEKSIVIELINGFIQGEAPVVDIDFLPSELLPNRPTEKTSIVDVLCIDSNNRHFVLEVQVIKQQSYKERVHYYASKLLVQSLEKSQQFA